MNVIAIYLPYHLFIDLVVIALLHHDLLVQAAIKTCNNNILRFQDWIRILALLAAAKAMYTATCVKNVYSLCKYVCISTSTWQMFIRTYCIFMKG